MFFADIEKPKKNETGFSSPRKVQEFFNFVEKLENFKK